MGDIKGVKRMECLVCKKAFEYDDDNTSVLIDHLNREHSNSQIFRFLGGDADRTAKNSPGIKWNPNEKLECHYCGKESNPVIKRDQSQNIKGIMGKMCFWCPFVMMCFPLGSKSRNFLFTYCPHCKKYIGAYDSTTGKLIRSRQ